MATRLAAVGSTDWLEAAGFMGGGWADGETDGERSVLDRRWNNGFR